MEQENNNLNEEKKDPLVEIIDPLLEWFEQNKRSFPWREVQQPYHVWISEIMLQQTRIEAVIEHYNRFMQELPDIGSLSRVSEERLLKLWEGLGYYSRAKNLKKAAQVIMEQYDGQMPRTYEQLITLAGIGEYTAGAIASFCFGEKVPAVDGNVLRVLARLTGDRENVLLPQTKKAAAARLRSIMPEQAGAFNEAIMELGETVCLPGGVPKCDICPLKGQCTAYRESLTAELPVRIKVMKRKTVHKTIFLLCSEDNRIAIEKRQDKGLLAGMYQLPNTDRSLSPDQADVHLREWGIEAKKGEYLGEAKHMFTHIDWIMRGYRFCIRQKNDRFIWVTKDELERAYALPTAFRVFLNRW